MPRSRKSTPGLADRVRAASAKRRGEHKLETREVIFRAAVELLDQAGYDGFSQRKLAARIGYTPTTIYRYFRDKDELVIAVMLESYREFTQALAAASGDSLEPFVQLEALGRAYVRFGISHPVMYRVLFMQRPDIWRRIPPERVAAACGQDAFQLLVNAVQRAIGTGRTRTKDVQAASLALWSLVHGVVSLCLAMPELADPAARAGMIEGAFALADLESRA
jgi:AcrR family transcriptional regulator